MQAPHLVILLVAMALCSSAQDQVSDGLFAPADKEKKGGQPEKEMAYRDDSGFLIRFNPVLDPSELGSALWPKHDAPLILNRSFDRPKHVWELHSGYFIAYEAGEWGGALFYLQKGTTTPVRILEDWVSSIVEIAPNTYIVAGGLNGSGTVHRLWIDKNQHWRHRQLLETDLGDPWFRGMNRARNEVLVVFSHCNETTKANEDNVCGVSASGAIHQYGICKYVPVDDQSRR